MTGMRKEVMLNVSKWVWGYTTLKSIMEKEPKWNLIRTYKKIYGFILDLVRIFLT